MPATMHYIKPGHKAKKPLLQEKVAEALAAYFEDLDGIKAHNVYNLVLQEVERPLMQAVMAFTNNNQSRSAEILGLNRGTFRKKLHVYGML